MCSMSRGGKVTPEFRREAVRLALTSGRTRREVADDLGVGLSSLTRWIGSDREEGGADEADSDLRAELKRLRRENAVLKQSTTFQEKRPPSSPERQVDELCLHRGGEGTLPDHPDVPDARRQPERLFCLGERPACQRQRADLVHLAHIRTAFALSNGTCGTPRMHRDLVDEGHAIGRHRTARLMRQNCLIARQKRRFKRRTDSEHAWPIAPV